VVETSLLDEVLVHNAWISPILLGFNDFTRVTFDKHIDHNVLSTEEIRCWNRLVQYIRASDHLLPKATFGTSRVFDDRSLQMSFFMYSMFSVSISYWWLRIFTNFQCQCWSRVYESTKNRATMSFYYTFDFYKLYIHSKKHLNDMFRSLIVNSYYKPLSFLIRSES
jgi:hypothetical protein